MDLSLLFPQQICIKPARREITQEDIDEAKSNPAEKKLRELWMEEIDRES